MVRQLRCLLFLDSHPLSLIGFLRCRCVCYEPSYSEIPGNLDWRVLGVPCPPLCQIHRLWVFCWRILSIFSGRSWEGLLGLSLAFFDALHESISGAPWSSCLYLSFSGRSSSPGDLNFLDNRLVLVSGLLVCTGCFPCLIR